VCINNDKYWWNQYVDKWVKSKRPTDYGYATWSDVMIGLNFSKWTQLLNLIYRYQFYEIANIKILVSNRDIELPDNDKTVKYFDNNNLCRIKTKAFIDDTINDLCNRIIRLYNLSDYNNVPIKNIKIVCYNYGVIEYNIQYNYLVFYTATDTIDLKIDDKLVDIDYFYLGRNNNFFSNLQTYNRTYVWIDA
jgi:hypothetical protein